MGWIPDYPDIRDYTKETAEVREAWAWEARRPGILLRGQVSTFNKLDILA
jgi:hypothetical protein